MSVSPEQTCCHLTERNNELMSDMKTLKTFCRDFPEKYNELMGQNKNLWDIIP